VEARRVRKLEVNRVSGIDRDLLREEGLRIDEILLIHAGHLHPPEVRAIGLLARSGWGDGDGCSGILPQ
jgi:hypothetical protein